MPEFFGSTWWRISRNASICSCDALTRHLAILIAVRAILCIWPVLRLPLRDQMNFRTVLSASGVTRSASVRIVSGARPEWTSAAAI
jgi:hypothetical protein